VKGFERLRLCRAGYGKICRARNGAKFNALDGMGLRGIDLQHHAGKLVGIAFLHDSRTFCTSTVTRLLQIKPAGLLAETISPSISPARAG